MADFRKFVLTDADNTVSIDLNDFNGYLATAPTGLGIYRVAEYITIGNQRIQTNNRNAFQKITLNVQILGERSTWEQKYATLRDFISVYIKRGFRLYYSTEIGTRYVKCDVNIVDKTEKDFSQKVYITDRVGAVPAKAEKHPGVYSLEEFMEEDAELPPDTLVVTLSEPIRKKGKEKNWQKLFRYSPRCKDTLDYPLNIAGEPKVDSTGTVWTLVLGDFNMVVGQCIRTSPKASYKDLYGNGMGRGGVEIEGDNGDMYLYEVAPNPAVSGLDKKVKWIPPHGGSWVKVPDTLSTIKIAAVAPYKAQITIFDDYSNVVASFKQSFGYDGEMDEDIRTNSENRAAIGFLYWDQRTDEGRKVGTGVYIWRIDFKFKDGHKEFRIVKTGIRRKN